MKFCDNPECLNHIEIGEGIEFLEKISWFNDRKTVGVHYYLSNGRVKFRLCDSCHGAIIFHKNLVNNNKK